MADANPYAQGIFNAVKGAMGLMDDYNKVSDVGSSGPNNGVGGEEPIEEYQSKYTLAQAKAMRAGWKQLYSTYYGGVEKKQKLAYDYWLGKQRTDPLETIDGHDTVDNQIFPALETFLPIANRANPDPVVQSDSSPQGVELAKNVKNALVNWADTHKLRMKLKKGTRNWALSLVGVWFMTYNVLTQEIECEALKVKDLYLDPDGHWDESALFTGDWIGRKKKVSAGVLSEMFPKFSEKIKELAGGSLVKKLNHEEWWYKGTDVFYFVEEECVGTFKNPNWNYDGEQQVENPDTEAPTAIPVIGRNHRFGKNAPQAPFIGLVVFNTDEGPHDETSLILQNIPMQDVVNKRFRQIDKNADSQNNGALASGDAFTKEQAAEAATFLRKGGTVWVPNGDVNTAWKRDAAPSLSPDIYQQLSDSRAEVKNSFGTAGSTAEGVQQEDTVRGKIMVNQSDSSRIGGGVTESIEQVADTIYNFVIQFMYVFYDEPHMIQVMGANGAAETISIRNTDFTMDVNVTVKDGSLIPKDPLTERNEAMDLWSAQAIGLPELYTRLDFADPMESAKATLTWQMVAEGKLPPQVLFPDFAAPMAPVNEAAPGVNQPPAQGEEQGQPAPDSPGAVQQQSSQLLASVPANQPIQ